MHGLQTIRVAAKEARSGPWFAVYCAPRREGLAADNLRRQGYETFFPHTIEWEAHGRSRSRLVHKAFLTGYLFVVLDLEHSAYGVNETDGVVSVVYGSAGPGTSVPIPADVMNRFFWLTDKTGQIQCTKRAKRHFDGDPGDVIRFAEKTPLFGLLAEIEKVFDDGKRISVRLAQMFGAQRNLVIAPSDVGELIRKAADR
jgi:transcription antitermination factor NusG